MLRRIPTYPHLDLATSTYSVGIQPIPLCIRPIQRLVVGLDGRDWVECRRLDPALSHGRQVGPMWLRELQTTRYLTGPGLNRPRQRDPSTRCSMEAPGASSNRARLGGLSRSRADQASQRTGQGSRRASSKSSFFRIRIKPGTAPAMEFTPLANTELEVFLALLCAPVS